MVKLSTELCRKMSAFRLGFKHSEETKSKMRGHDNRPFPPKCIKCPSRDVEMCARYNQRCFDAREVVCFKVLPRRKEHTDYKKNEYV